MRACVVPTSIMALMALILSQAIHASTANGPRGVAPSRIKLYSPDNSGNWKCLDGSKTIPSTSINDDYCDCIDGSDEPGTSACGNTYFYCENVGHMAAYVKSSRVNDRVCDPECCDGTDEYDGITHCPNICEHVGAEAKKERERVRKVEKEGGKIRQGYVTFGKDAKQKLGELLTKLKDKADQVKQAAIDAKDELDMANAKQQEYLESSRIEREMARNRQLEPFVERFKERLDRALGDKHLLRATLDMLKEKHNKNYHDMAVKDTITGFDEYLKEVEQNTTTETESDHKEDDSNLSMEQRIASLRSETQDIRRNIGKMFKLMKSMKEGYNTEYNDEAVLKTVKVLHEFEPSWRDELDEYATEEPIQLPEIIPSTKASDVKHKGAYGQAQRIAKSVGLGFLFKEEKSELAKAQEVYNKASEEERKVQRETEDAEQKLGRDYGKDETFAKLADECFDYKDAEYTYTLCLFGRALQKSHSETSLGTFSSWDGDNYDTQLYTGGARCWNGPERSVKVVMSCGAKNEIVAVSEPSKCEYLYKFRTPALCRLPSELKDDSGTIPEPVMPGAPLESQVTKRHDEL